MIEISGKGIAMGVVAGIGLYLFAKGEIRTAFKAVNLVDRENVFNQGAKKVGAAVSGNEHFNLGTWAYEVLNPIEVAKERAVITGTNNRATNGSYDPPTAADLMSYGTS